MSSEPENKATPNPLDTESLGSIRKQFKTRGLAIFNYDDGPVHSYPYDTPWLEDVRFSDLYQSIRNHTLVDRIRCHSIYTLCQQVSDIPGDILEVGVWRGGTSAILAANLLDKTAFLADTFHGVRKSSEWEHYIDCAHNDTNRNIVNNLLSESLGLTNYEILEGIFPDETGYIVKSRHWSIVHIDVDVYLSARDAFQFVWKNVSPGGIVIFDDYGFHAACGGIGKFVDEIKSDSDKLFIPNMNGQAYIVKRG